MVHGPSAWMLLLFVIAVYRLRFYILHLQLDVSLSYCLCNSVLVTIVVWFVYFCIHMQFVYKLTRFMYSILLLCCNCIQQNEPGGILEGKKQSKKYKLYQNMFRQQR